MSNTAKYETTIIFDAALSEEERTATLERFKEMIAANGTIEKVDEWGKRRLAYEIDKKTEGYYVLILFEGNTDFIKELDRVYNITDAIIRTMTVKAVA